MSSASPALSRDDGEIYLRRLESQHDGVLWRCAVRCANRWRSRRLAFVGPLAAARFDIQLEKPSLALLAASLAGALRVGALESAAVFADELEPKLSQLTERAASSAREDLIETFIACGESTRGERLALEHLATLRRSSNGVALLEVLGLGDGAVLLPNGRPNMLGLSQRLGAGELDARALARLLGRDPRRWLREPELDLLFWSALRGGDQSRALGWLNRFLFRHGLASYRWSSGSLGVENPLEALAPAASRPACFGPLVSVLVSARNAAGTISYALRSLTEQTYERLEILVCDDASDDLTTSVMRELAARDGRVRVFRSKVNQGSYNVRNALAERARGELVTFHDADDLALPSRIADQVAVLRDTGAAACVASGLRLDSSGRVVFFKNQRATRMALVTTMLTRSAFERFGPFRAARVGADLELFADLCASSSRAVIRLKKPLILALWSGSSATRSTGTEALASGYRSPLRRAYSQLVYAKHAGFGGATEAEIDARLQATCNRATPSEIIELP